MVIDAHTHINFSDNNTLLKEFSSSKYITGINIIAIDGVISEEEIQSKIKKEVTGKKNIYITASVSLDSIKKHSYDYFNQYDFLKIHPRLQNLTPEDVFNLLTHIRKNNIKRNIIIDMFPYGKNNYNISNCFPLKYEQLLIEFSDYNFIFAHFGGIYLREVFMMMKCYPNLWVDTSLITRYFKDSPIENELYYFIKRLEGNRVLYGSDYPEMGLDQAYKLQYEKMVKNKIKKDAINLVMYKNFQNLISLNNI